MDDDAGESLVQIKSLLGESCQFNIEHENFATCSECGKTVCLECLDYELPHDSLKFVCTTCTGAEHSIINKRYGMMMACCMLCIILVVVVVLVIIGI